jgi:hypothetical protein
MMQNALGLLNHSSFGEKMLHGQNNNTNSNNNNLSDLR